MKVLLVSFTSLIQELYHGLPRELAKLPGVELTVLVSPFWKELWSTEKRMLEVTHASTYTMRVGSTLFAGNLHLAIFSDNLKSLLNDIQPDIIDLEDEPFNAGSAQMVYLRNRLTPRSRIVLHASQSVMKRYPPPFGAFERYTLKNTDAILARNEDARNVLQYKGYKGRIEIVTHGVDPDAFAQEKHEAKKSLGMNKEFVVGYVGAVVKQKGLDTLLYAVTELDCHLCIVGDGSYKPYLLELSQKLGIEQRIRWVPAVAHKEVPKYLCAMDIFVLPSRTWPNWREKFGRVLIEAMAAGTPVVGSDSGEIPKVIGDAGVIFHEGDDRDLHSRLRTLMESAEERTRLSQVGKERVKAHYSWEVIAQKTYTLYQNLLGGK